MHSLCVSLFQPCLCLIKFIMPAKRAPFPVRSSEADGAAWAALPGRKEAPCATGTRPRGHPGGTGAVRTERDCRDRGCAGWGTEELAMALLDQLGVSAGPWLGLQAQSLQGVGQWAAVTSAPHLPLTGMVGSCRSVESSWLIRGI